MRATLHRAQASHRRGDRGAVLVVVLLVMMALLGMGLVGLYLTTGSIQMNANINMRNQALFVAEAGINRAKSVLNRTIPGLPTWSPNLSGMLSGRSPLNAAVVLNVSDEIPSDPVSGCLAADGTARGAYLRDEPGSVTGCSSNSAYVNCTVSYSNNLADPNAPPPPPTQNMGTYTLFIRQDLAECRIGNFTCDSDPNNPDPSCPTANGIVVIRSEGTASDTRTRVVLEVTMARNPNAPVVNSKLATVCPAGQAGCDDNASVQQGITVSGALTPPTAGTSGSSQAGASGAAGSAGAGGATGGAAGASSTTPLAGNTSSSTVSGGGGPGGASSTSSSSQGCPSGQNMCGSACCAGTCVSNTCCPKASQCNNIAIVGEYGAWGSNGEFKDWLSTHSSACNSVDTLTIDSDANSSNNWTAKLSNYGIVIILDVFHTHAEAIANPWGFGPGSYRQTGTQRQFTASEVLAITNWVRGGGGLVTTIGTTDVNAEFTNPNLLLANFNLAYAANGNGFLQGYPVKCWIKNGDPNCVWRFVPPARQIGDGLAVPLDMTRILNLQADNGCGIKALGPGPVVFAEILPNLTMASKGKVGMVVDNTMGSPSGQGRVVVWADEWLTYNHDWLPDMLNHPECPAEVDTSTPYWRNNLNSCTQRFWNNIVAWVRGGCH